MKRIGFVLQVKKDLIEEYKEHHRNVWPEMQTALRAAGWHNYSLFMREDGLLFGYFETPESLDAAIAAMDQEEVNARWQAMMNPYFAIPAGARPDQMFVELDAVFHLD